jgi:hypothetical protein
MARFDELDRCVFSVVMQEYRPASVNILAQRFTTDQIDALRARLAPVMAVANGVSLNVINFQEREPKDARARLLNMGLSHTSGRFIALLDYDDTIYPEAYTKLVERLRNTDCAIAFGRIVVKRRDVFEDALIVTAKENKFVGQGLLDLFTDNFCPIHSFVLDRSRIPAEQLYFSELLSRLEDYDLLLRIVSQCTSDFQIVAHPVGDYYFKNDGSNTVQVSDADTSKDLEDWTRARSYIGVMKAKTVISDVVQRRLGLAEPIGGLTIEKLVTTRRKWEESQKTAKA